MPNIILGPPGTGKTTALLNILEENLHAGTQSHRVGFISFTRKAAYEARDRAMARFNLLEEEVPYFRTIHSLAFRQLGLSHSQLMQKGHYLEIADKLGIELTGPEADPLEGTFTSSVAGDRYLFAEGLSRVRGISLRQQWEEMNDDTLDWFELKQVAESLENYKRQHMLYDFTDLLTRCNDEAALPKLDVLFVDECQDLAPLQWRIVERLISNSCVTYLAGDDDQAIYTWAGADVDYFIRLEGERKVLAQSFRIPATVHELAGNVISRVSRRNLKPFRPRDEAGEVNYCGGMFDVDLSSGTWLLLARSRRQLREYERACIDEGVPYSLFDRSPLYSSEFKAIQTFLQLKRGAEVRVDAARGMISLCSLADTRPMRNIDDESMVDMAWIYANCNLPSEDALTWSEILDKITFEDAEYFNALIESNDLEPRVKISTIHGVKGGEAQNVVIMQDIYRRVLLGLEENPDNEHRVFYVGVTRAKEKLFIITPRSPRSYDL